jgi:hypothetical protein
VFVNATGGDALDDMMEVGSRADFKDFYLFEITGSVPGW